MKEADSWKTFERTGQIRDYLKYKNQIQENAGHLVIEAKQNIDEENHERFCGTYRNGSGTGSGGGI